MTLAEFLRHQRQSLVNEMRAEWADPSFMTLPRSRLEQLRTEGALKVKQLNELSSDSLVLKFIEHDPQLWVDTGLRAYRKTFQSYLKNEFNVKEPLPRGLHVDHLDPVFKFSNCIEGVYVRLVLVPGCINSRYGAGFERQSNQYNKTLSRPSGHNLTYMAFFKAVGHNIPLRSEGGDAWGNWIESGIQLLLVNQIIDECEIEATRNALHGEVKFRFGENNITRL